MPIGNEMTREKDVLRSELSSLPGLLRGGGMAEMHALLAQRVGLLDDSMRRHVANAERGGSLDVVTTEQPGMASHLARRREEHRPLLMEGEQRRANLAAVAELRCGLLRLRERLGRHEIAEYDLMQRAVCDDLGAGD